MFIADYPRAAGVQPGDIVDIARNRKTFSVDLFSATSGQSAAIDPINFGAVGDGVTDDTAAIQRAADSSPASGGTLLLKKTYLISAAIYLKSNVTVLGGGTLKAAWPWLGKVPTTGGGFTAGQPFQVMLSNVNSFIASSSALIDTNILVSGINFDWPDPTITGGALGAAHSIHFRKVQTVTVRDCTFVNGGDGTAFLGCADTLVSGCFASGTVNAAYDHWDGPHRATVTDSTAILSGGYGVAFNAIATGNSAIGDAENLTVQNVRILAPGSNTAGIFVDPLGAQSGSSAGRITISDCYVKGGNSNAAGIVVRGWPGYFIITNNIISSILESNAIQVGNGGSPASPQPTGVIIKNNILTDCTISSGGLINLVNITDGMVEGNVAEGGSYQHLTVGQGTTNLIVGPNVATPSVSKHLDVGGAVGTMVFDADVGNQQFNFNAPVLAQQGVQFSTASGQSVLGSYMQAGSWTPALTLGGASTGIAYNQQNGTYTKIGNVVFITGVVQLTSKGTATGVAVLTGLPFPAASGIVGKGVTAQTQNMANMTVQDASTSALMVYTTNTAKSLRLDVWGQVAASQMNMFIGCADVTAPALMDTNLTNTSYWGVEGWYFAAS